MPVTRMKVCVKHRPLHDKCNTRSLWQSRARKRSTLHEACTACFRITRYGLAVNSANSCRQRTMWHCTSCASPAWALRTSHNSRAHLPLVSPIVTNWIARSQSDLDTRSVELDVALTWQHSRWPRARPLALPSLQCFRSSRSNRSCAGRMALQKPRVPLPTDSRGSCDERESSRAPLAAGCCGGQICLRESANTSVELFFA